MGPILAFLLYMGAKKLNGIHGLDMLRDLGHQYGFLDGDMHERDGVPDHSMRSVIHSLLKTGAARPMMTTMIASRTSQGPTSMSPWILVEIGAYAVVLDTGFYWYYRCMHDIESLWKYHRTHHLTKHPNPLLTLYADTEQEIMDVVGIPLVTWGTLKLLGFPIGFHEWWICHQYIVFTELWGHSGLRVFHTAPSTATPFLKLFDAELVTEDHDLHHRKGWKKSHNHGKQTRLWDQVFGTTHERYETTPANLDWNDSVKLKCF